MAKLSLQALGRKILEKRGDKGVRAVAQEIGVSPATLSRIERGYAPDIETFGKVCRWLDIDPGEVLGLKPTTILQPTASIHFRNKQTIKPETAQALAQLIIAAQRALSATNAA